MYFDDINLSKYLTNVVLNQRYMIDNLIRILGKLKQNILLGSVCGVYILDYLESIFFFDGEANRDR